MNLRHLLPVTVVSAIILGGAAQTAFAQTVPPITVNNAWVDVTYRDSPNPADQPVTDRFNADPKTLNKTPKVSITLDNYWLTDRAVRDGDQMIFRPDFDPILFWDVTLHNATDIGYKNQAPTLWASITWQITPEERALGLKFIGLGSNDFRTLNKSADGTEITFSDTFNGPIQPGSSTELFFQMFAPYGDFTITSIPKDPNGKPVVPPAVPEAGSFALAAAALPFALGVWKRRRMG